VNCPSDSYCGGNEVCMPKKPSGAPCASPHECLSGACFPGDGGLGTCGVLL
jgi:hypothetical protein